MTRPLTTTEDGTMTRLAGSRPLRIGIDVGGVLTDQIKNDATEGTAEDTSFRGDNFMRTTRVPGSFEAVRELVVRYGAENTFIVTKCGPAVFAKTMIWLRDVEDYGFGEGASFYNQTGFSADSHNLYCCLRRAQKAPIARGLGLDVFIDDTLAVHRHLLGVVDCRILFGPQKEAPTQDDLDGGLQVAETWTDVLGIISSLSSPA